MNVATRIKPLVTRLGQKIDGASDRISDTWIMKEIEQSFYFAFCIIGIIVVTLFILSQPELREQLWDKWWNKEQPALEILKGIWERPQ